MLVPLAEAPQQQSPAPAQGRKKPEPVQRIVAYRLQNYEPPGAAASDAGVSRLAGFRVLQSVDVADPAMRDEIVSIFAHAEGFNDQAQSCLHPEMAFSFSAPPAGAIASPAGAEAIVLVSLSCNRVESRGFSWPFSANGLELATLQRLATIADKLFVPH